MKRRGFTLIELLIVLVILAVIVGMAVPNFSKTRTGVRLRTTAENVLYYMRYAHNRSVEEGVIFKMIINDDTVQLQKAAAGSDPDQDPVFGAVSGKMGRPLDLPEDLEFQSPPRETLFYPDGAIDKVKFALAGPSGKMFLSTKDIPGNVVLLEEEKE